MELPAELAEIAELWEFFSRKESRQLMRGAILGIAGSRNGNGYAAVQVLGKAARIGLAEELGVAETIVPARDRIQAMNGAPISYAGHDLSSSLKTLRLAADLAKFDSSPSSLTLVALAFHSVPTGQTDPGPSPGAPPAGLLEPYVR